jgi:hypothetical protein
MAAEVWFTSMVPVPGTSLRIDRFSTCDGWKVAETPAGIIVSRAANDPQNIPEVPAFRVVGVGYCLTETPEAEGPGPKKAKR